MSLKLYNTRTRSVEAFVPLIGRRVRIYVCGLTPSAQAHLGHARSFLFFDVFRRYLVHRGYDVTFVQNVTDIDDRSINRARETGEDWRAIVSGYFASFKNSMGRLHVVEPDHEPHATEFIPQILDMIARLVQKEYAYVTPDGVYYSVAKFPRYGKLSGRRIDELESGARIEVDEAKRDPLDFALWKFAKPGEPSWESPWGPGRPGWHIECSAMAWQLLGEQFDIHGGGFDLVFPHHENEIAQTEVLSEKPPLANIWMHGGLLLFDNHKMSKSLGNFEPLGQLLERHDPQAIRMLFLQTGYRKPMNFTEDSVASATGGLRRLLEAYDGFVARSDAMTMHRMETQNEIAEGRLWFDAEFYPRFYAAMDDDINTSGALSVLFDLANRGPEMTVTAADPAARDFLYAMMTILGISPDERQARALKGLAADLPERLHGLLGDEISLNGSGPEEAIEAVIAARTAARAAKDFARSDRLRDALGAVGVAIKDSKAGTTWTLAE